MKMFYLCFECAPSLYYVPAMSIFKTNVSDQTTFQIEFLSQNASMNSI